MEKFAGTNPGTYNKNKVNSTPGGYDETKAKPSAIAATTTILTLTQYWQVYEKGFNQWRFRVNRQAFNGHITTKRVCSCLA